MRQFFPFSSKCKDHFFNSFLILLLLFLNGICLSLCELLTSLRMFCVTTGTTLQLLLPINVRQWRTFPFLPLLISRWGFCSMGHSSWYWKDIFLWSWFHNFYKHNRTTSLLLHHFNQGFCQFQFVRQSSCRFVRQVSFNLCSSCWELFYLFVCWGRFRMIYSWHPLWIKIRLNVLWKVCRSCSHDDANYKEKQLENKHLHLHHAFVTNFVSSANEKHPSTREEKSRLSKRSCKCSVFCINSNEIPNHFT